MPAKTCKWTYCEFHDCWDTQCGNDFTLMNGTPTDNKMVYCPYCGKKIQEEKEVEDVRRR